MKVKHYIAVDTKEVNDEGLKLLLPITPPYRTLKELGDAIGITNLRHLYKLCRGEVINQRQGIGIEIVYLTKENSNEGLCTKDKSRR